jgi:hypothetical protein
LALSLLAWGLDPKYRIGQVCSIPALFQSSDSNSKSGVLIQAGMQGVLASAMHCAEAVVGFINDEASWQDAFSRYAESPNAFVPKKYQIRWQSIFLFITKFGIQVVFSYAVSVDVMFSVSFLPFVVVTAVILITAVTLEVMARRAPKTGGPTTYGEFNLLFRYISKYHLIWL